MSNEGSDLNNEEAKSIYIALDQPLPDTCNYLHQNIIIFLIVKKSFEFRPIYKQNSVTDHFYYKIGAKPSDYEEFFKIPLMKKFHELHKNPTMRIRLSAAYNETYTASMIM